MQNTPVVMPPLARYSLYALRTPRASAFQTRTWPALSPVTSRLPSGFHSRKSTEAPACSRSLEKMHEMAAPPSWTAQHETCPSDQPVARMRDSPCHSSDTQSPVSRTITHRSKWVPSSPKNETRPVLLATAQMVSRWHHAIFVAAALASGGTHGCARKRDVAMVARAAEQAVSTRAAEATRVLGVTRAFHV